jgi:IS5 family transposase
MNLFEPASAMFSPMTIKYLSSDWPGVFRGQMLHLMPVDALGEHFDAKLGCPTKELYGMAGAIFLKEFFNLTIPQTVERYLTDAAWQYALNVNPMEASLSHATVERYLKLFAENDLANEVFHRVTSALIEALELDVSRQRLDSTHIYSDMATFGRSKLMGVVIKRFLTQLKRHHPDLYASLDKDFLARYAPSQAKLFGDFSGSRSALRQAVAEDLLMLMSRFADDAKVCHRSSYKAMERVLHEQCDVEEETVELKKKTGGDVMQNPSDPDATYDGHKGPGHQAQIAETCSEENDVQLITGVETAPAHTSDQDALEPMLDQLEAHDRKPEILYADTGYGSDDNVTHAENRSVDLQSPVPGGPKQNPDDLTIDDFVVDEATQTVGRCPNGHEPISSVRDHDKGRTRTVMDASHCLSCPHRDECPVKKVRDEYVIEHTPAEHRTASRRAEQATDAFRENYAIRGGGESVNSGLKRKTGMGRLRVRGSPRVRMAVLLRCAGWNLFRALAALKHRGIRDLAAVFAASALIRAFVCRIIRLPEPSMRLDRRNSVLWPEMSVLATV